jgi:hypothetical protein
VCSRNNDALHVGGVLSSLEGRTKINLDFVSYGACGNIVVKAAASLKVEGSKSDIVNEFLQFT